MERIIINRYIWIFGENLGKSANSNSYHLWRHIVNIDDAIDKYIVFEKNNHTKKVYNTLSKHEKKFVLWKNSIKHFRKFLNADLFFVGFSYLDVCPDKLFLKPMSMRLKKPFIHLQSGNVAVKIPNETGQSYANNILRFLYYNGEIKDDLTNYNDFKPYQLHYEKYQPKYGDLIRKVNENHTNNQILWFLSSREYIKEDVLHVKSLSITIKRILKDSSLRKFLKENSLTLKVCTHLFLEDELYNEINQCNDDLIKIVKQEDIDTGLEIAKSRLLITDYSSIVYDFSFLEKDYILFQPDRNKFMRMQGLRQNDDLNEFIIKKPSDLISKLLSREYEKNSYIEKGKPEDIDFEYLKENKHLDDYYTYFKTLQENKITFMGYNFYGIGGTVNATMALAEGLLKKGYFVNVLSLNKLTEIRHNPPYGLNMQYIQWKESGSIKDKLLKRIYKSEKNYSHLKHDYAKKNLHPYVGHELDRIMKNIKTTTLVSTRESLHLFLNDCISENVKNKIFIFHAHVDMIEDNFPNLMNELKDINLEKAVFITEENRLALKNKFDYENYNKYINLGNTLIESKIIRKEEIKSIAKKDKYTAIYLLRISKNRKKDIENLIEFGKYIKNNAIDFIEIDVFGDGNYIDEFLDLIENNGLNEIIHYKLSTEEAISEIRCHDLMIDFSVNHSFGMIYIEAILNGKKVFCMKNSGSMEVLENIPNSYIESYEWLCSQIKTLDKIHADELKEKYDKICEKYSQDAISSEFLDFLEEI